jgi:hypothetical protein
MPLLRGRLIGEEDHATSAPVVVLSRDYARGMFGSDDVVGREIEFGSPPMAVRVVGIVGDVRYESYAENARPALYFPRTQQPSELACLVVSVSPEAGNLGPAIVKAIRDVDPAVPAMNVTTVDQILEESVADRRFYAAATTTFAGLALLLTIAGLVVVVSRTVVEGRREIAVRMALGAGAIRLHALVVRRNVYPVLAGTVVGLLGAAAGARLLATLLFQVEARSASVYGGVALLVLIASLMAALVPALVATKIPPSQALRAE